MPNQNKIKIVKNIEDKFKNSSGLYFTKYTGMDVAQATKLRKSFRENSVEYKVTKNTLTECWKEVILVIVGGYISSFAKLVEFWYNSPADDQELVRSSQDFSTGLNGN